jgi:aminopeptidase N
MWLKLEPMKKILPLVLLLLSQAAFAQKVDVYSRPVQVERSRDFDALHYRISLRVDMEKKSFEGENRITLVPLNDGLKGISLDADSLVVGRVELSDGTGMRFVQSEHTVKIDLGRSYGHRDTVTLTVYYRLDKPTLGLRFIDATETSPLQVSSDCFPNKARQWIPCYDYPNDKVTEEMIVTVARPFKVLSNGRLVGVKENADGTQTWHWSQELPHSTYLTNLSIADYDVIDDSYGSLPLHYWVYPGQRKDAERSFRKTPHMIEFFNQLYGFPFPWAKYDQVISHYMNGGAEATSATLLGEGAITDSAAEQDYSWEWIIAHELAHQWWGDVITLRSWDQTWLNESFATYSDYLYTRAEAGEDAGAWNLEGKRNQYLNEAHNKYIRPIVFDRYDNPGDNFDSHTYPKGANVLHLLRHILGDDTFFRVLSTFLHENAFKPVDTHDFMKAVKEVSGKNMDWFFDEFIFRPGHPVFEVTQSWDPDRKMMMVNILQKQDSLPGVPVYTLPVNLGFFLPEGKQVKEVWLKAKSESFEFPFDSEPLLVRFDDGNFVLKEVTFKKPVKELLYQAENDDVVGRYSAVNELKPYGDNPDVRKVWLKRAAGDPFWAVRQAAVTNLVAWTGKDAMDILMNAARDENSKVRQTAVRLLGDRKDPSLVPFYKKTFGSDGSYAVQAEALRAIGKCGGKKDLAFLKKAQKEKSYRNVVGNAAAAAMKAVSK